MTLALAVILLPFIAAFVLAAITDASLQARIAFAVSVIVLALSAVLALGSPWGGAPESNWLDNLLAFWILPDRIAALISLLVAVTAAARCWRRQRRAAVSRVMQPGQRRRRLTALPVTMELLRIAEEASPPEARPEAVPAGAPVRPAFNGGHPSAARRARYRMMAWPAGQITLGGLIAACLAANPLSAWLGLVVAAAAARYREGRGLTDRAVLTAAALLLAMFGEVSMQAALPGGLAAPLCLVIGYGTLAAVLPVSLPVVLLVLARHQGLLAGSLLGARMDSLLVWIGLAAALICGSLLAFSGKSRRGAVIGAAPESARIVPPALITLGQGALAAFAFGLGGSAAAFAATLHLVLLVLTGASVSLSRPGESSRCAALAGLAGIPPFGVFPSLALILWAAIRQSPWTVAPLAAAILLLGWSAITRLPPFVPAAADAHGRSRRVPAYAELAFSPDSIPAWLPLALALLIGLFLPDTASDWLRQAPVGLP